MLHGIVVLSLIKGTQSYTFVFCQISNTFCFKLKLSCCDSPGTWLVWFMAYHTLLKTLITPNEKNTSRTKAAEKWAGTKIALFYTE